MSSIAIKWARSQNFGSAALKSVVTAIALRADPKGATWASQATLAHDAGMTDRNVRRHLVVLEAVGVIHRIARSKGRYGRSSDLITLALHRTFDLSAKELRAARDRLSEKSSNRTESTLPTGQRCPGNSKGTTFGIIQGGGLSGLSAVGTYPKRPALAVVNGSAVLSGWEDEL